MRRLILRLGILPTAIGAVAGTFVAALATQLVQHWLFGIQPFDPLVLAAAPLLLLGVAGASSLVAFARIGTVAPNDLLQSR